MRAFFTIGVLACCLGCKPSTADLRRQLALNQRTTDRTQRAIKVRQLVDSVSRIDNAGEFDLAADLLSAILREPSTVDPAALDAIEQIKIDGEFGELLCGEWVARTLRDPEVRQRYRADRGPIRGCLSLEAPAELQAPW